MVTTHCEYDVGQVMQQIKQAVFSVVILAVLHFKWQIVQPLALQCIFPLKQIWDSKVVQVHIFGKPATGDYQRPFKAENMFAGMYDEQGYAVEGNARQTRREEERKEKKKTKKN